MRPKVVAVADERAAAAGGGRGLPECEVRGGADAMASLATDADVVVNGVVGFAGLSVTLATLEAGRRLALANKESLIAAGPVVQRARRTPGAELVPVDSEHGAIHQCLRATDNRQPGRPAAAHRQRRARSGAAPATTWPTSPSTRRWPTPPGAWAPRSPSTPRRS